MNATTVAVDLAKSVFQLAAAHASPGLDVKLLPAQYIHAYVKRNRTDAAYAAALLEAARASDILPVRVR
ncbi:MAG: hypothetical protein Q8R06_09405 [Polaromonas sp.]|uniref:hypothetical protein n=1 Tax=Polaromonas sp. TaxID=1869339 RepID=UPI0027358099|nr:hypothetical protein [Polaromonas sp.]MDP3797356.1 hypothetical protein [Polaromonas sp.]